MVIGAIVYDKLAQLGHLIAGLRTLGREDPDLQQQHDTAVAIQQNCKHPGQPKSDIMDVVCAFCGASLYDPDLFKR
jgi:hypothetical protein